MDKALAHFVNHAADWIDRLGPRVQIAIGTVLIVAVTLFAVVYVNKVLYRFLFRLRFRFRISYEMIMFVTRLAGLLILIGAGLILLSFWGVSVAGLWTIFVSITAVVGVGFLAYWTIVSNITANIFIEFWRPFHMGATVEILPENLSGRVVDRNMMYTILREKGGSTLCIPNNLFFQKIFRVTESNQQHLFEYLESEKETIVDTY